jgi:hypothetical protein
MVVWLVRARRRAGQPQLAFTVNLDKTLLRVWMT